MFGLQKSRDDDVGTLKELMIAVPMTMEIYAAIRRKKIEARSMIEDARETAKQRRGTLDE
ncbi:MULTISPECIES: hypothetical protein [Collimonas]|uniref:Uncharacterized protein n=2 Tax=Collimonas TaxID=202907 RepID=A0A127QQA4_9BURK|nr:MULTISPECIES: hypothetical protein [Collimonas]AMP02080.1 hypothetical protein CAter10_4690 [Collimonas arenae]AMP11975.1 hypothetical protein CAter282_4315 [Collimonas arenae]AMP17228.1 hypothetical protein CPter291_5015 [Collimonas pratensis]